MNEKNKRKANDIQCTPKEKDIRNKITQIIVWSVVIAMGLIAIVAIGVPLLQKNEPNFDFIGQALLPLWATWMGTVIAFYFGKSNFDAATKSYGEIINKLTPEEKLEKTPVTKVMIPFEKMVTMDFEDSMSLLIQQILDIEKFKYFNRYAFIDDNNVLRAIIHRRNFAQYISDHVEQALDGINPKMTTFKDFMEECNKNEYADKPWKGEAMFISIYDSMLTAAKMISSKSNVRDAFVTLHGKKEEPVLGLITDEDILKTINC